MTIAILNKANSQFSAPGVEQRLCVLKEPTDVLNMEEKKKKKKKKKKTWL